MKTLAVMMILATCVGSAYSVQKLPRKLEKAQRERVEQIEGAEKAYVKELKKIRAEYFEDGDAAAVQAVDAALRDAGAAAEAANRDADADQTPARVYCKQHFDTFKKGVNISTIINSPHYTEVPPSYRGWKVSLTESPGKGISKPLLFKVQREGVVTVMLTSKRARKLILSGWTETAVAKMLASNGVAYDLTILEKYLEKGEYVFDQAIDSGHGIKLLLP